LRYLPPYAPDLHPIETFCSTRNARLTTAAPRRGEALWNAIGPLRDAVGATEGVHDFNAAGDYA
jgi:transposase